MRNEDKKEFINKYGELIPHLEDYKKGLNFLPVFVEAKNTFLRSLQILKQEQEGNFSFENENEVLKGQKIVINCCHILQGYLGLNEDNQEKEEEVKDYILRKEKEVNPKILNGFKETLKEIEEFKGFIIEKSYQEYISNNEILQRQILAYECEAEFFKNNGLEIREEVFKALQKNLRTWRREIIGNQSKKVKK